MSRGRFINLAGPSAGVGKSAMMAALAEIPELRIYILKTYTTRQPRERDPYDLSQHHFLSDKQFSKFREKGFFFESKRLRHHWYGSSAGEIEKELTRGQNVISDVDPQRIQTFKKRFPDMIAVFLDAPNSVLRKHMAGRGDSPHEIVARVRLAQRERKFKKFFDKTVRNDRNLFDETLAEIAAYLKSRLE